MSIKKKWSQIIILTILLIIISVPKMVKADLADAQIKVTGNYNSEKGIVTLKISGTSSWYPNNEVYYDLILKYDNTLLKIDDENVSIKKIDNGVAHLHILAKWNGEFNYKAEEEINFKAINKEKAKSIISIDPNLDDVETNCNNYCKEESSNNIKECVDTCLYGTIENMAVSSITIDGDSKYTVMLEATSGDIDVKDEHSINVENIKEKYDSEIMDLTKKYDKTNLIMYISLGINVLLLIVILIKLFKHKNK